MTVQVELREAFTESDELGVSERVVRRCSHIFPLAILGGEIHGGGTSSTTCSFEIRTFRHI